MADGTFSCLMHSAVIVALFNEVQTTALAPNNVSLLALEFTRLMFIAMMHESLSLLCDQQDNVSHKR